MKLVVCAALSMVAVNALAAEPCLENFSVQGSILTGKTYKTWASLPNVVRDDAFQRAYAFTVANGFTVLSASKEAGAISAAQSVSYGKGKTVPLNIVLQDEGGNVRVDLHYATSGGMLSPEDAIRKHFCLTIAAAATGNGAPAQVSEPASLAGSAPAKAPVRKTMPGFAIPTDAQLASYRREIPKNLPNPKLRPVVESATPAIAEFIERLACATSYQAMGALNAYAAPDQDLRNHPRPMGTMRYHDKGSCLTVTRVQGWRAPANNALEFEVVYTAEDSGEVFKLGHEAVRQPDGVWLFTR